MNLTEQLVIHKAFGEGKVIDHTGEYLSVLFEVGQKQFQYPDSFQVFLRAKDEAVQAAIQSELGEAKAQIQQLQQEREAAALLERKKMAEKRVVQTRTKRAVSPLHTNIAFKCNYCNGGKSSELIGFHGVCSEAVIRYNIEKNKYPWCSSPQSPCRQYYDRTIRAYAELEALFNQNALICSESTMLRDWSILAGISLADKSQKQPTKLKQAEANSLAVLTTRLPNEPEENRLIFAVFLVDEAYEGDAEKEGYVSNASRYKIYMAPKEAHHLKFWNYYACPNTPSTARFGSGLHRYLSDMQAAQILRDISAIKKGTDQDELAQDFLAHFGKIKRINLEDIPQNAGALKLK